VSRSGRRRTAPPPACSAEFDEATPALSLDRRRATPLSRGGHCPEGYVDTLTQLLDTGDRVFDYDYDDMGRVIRETVNPGMTESTVTEWVWDWS